MSNSDIPKDVVDFIVREIDSIEQLEILLLLAEGPDRAWSAQEVYGAILSSLPSVSTKLRDMSVRGLLTEDSAGYRFAPKDPERSRSVARLAEAYRTFRVRVINVIYTKPERQLQDFSDAFRIKKKE